MINIEDLMYSKAIEQLHQCDLIDIEHKQHLNGITDMTLTTGHPELKVNHAKNIIRVIGDEYKAKIV